MPIERIEREKKKRVNCVIAYPAPGQLNPDPQPLTKLIYHSSVAHVLFQPKIVNIRNMQNFGPLVQTKD